MGTFQILSAKPLATSSSVPRALTKFMLVQPDSVLLLMLPNKCLLLPVPRLAVVLRLSVQCPLRHSHMISIWLTKNCSSQLNSPTLSPSWTIWPIWRHYMTAHEIGSLLIANSGQIHEAPSYWLSFFSSLMPPSLHSHTLVKIVVLTLLYQSLLSGIHKQ